MKTLDKINKVKDFFKNRKVAIAFSGGADSTLLVHLAKQSNADILAITFDNHVDPSGFIEYAKKRACDFQIKHEIIESDYFETDLVANTPSRCYDCRKLMYASIKQVAFEKDYEIIVDGNNITDLIHDRPGILVKYENDISSPFIDAGLESHEIHKYLNDNEIEYSKSTTCLATRIKTNQKVTIEKINRIEYGESFIRDLTGNEIVRLREDNDTAIIEVDDLEMILDIEKIHEIEKELKNLQYNRILLDVNTYDDKSKLIEDFEIKSLQNGRLKFEKELPYTIDIKNTLKEFEKIDKIDNLGQISNIISLDAGYIKIEIEDKIIRLFEKGKVVLENLNTKEEIYLYLIKTLPLIRRKL